MAAWLDIVYGVLFIVGFVLVLLLAVGTAFVMFDAIGEPHDETNGEQ